MMTTLHEIMVHAHTNHVAGAPYTGPQRVVLSAKEMKLLHQDLEFCVMHREPYRPGKTIEMLGMQITEG